MSTVVLAPCSCRRQELERLCAALEAGRRNYPPPRVTVWDMLLALFALRRGRREIERVRRARGGRI